MMVFAKRTQYIPQQEDLVIGVVSERMGESYKMDLGAPHAATLAVGALALRE